jgi:hypothetical protein
VLLKCFAGCETQEIVEALGLDISHLFPRERTKPTAKTQNGAGLTLDEYAEEKRLPVKFLQKHGIGQIYLQGAPAVRIPYMDASGNVLSTRMRVSMKNEPRFIWKNGSKSCLYGIWRLSEYSGRYLCAVEGESDSQTLWLHNFPAIGLPGAATWQESWASYLDRFQHIYLVIERDKGGEAVLKWLRTSKIRARVRLITVDGAKDASGLYLSDPENFTRAWQAAMKAAVPWSSLEDKEKKARADAAWAECQSLAREPDILSLFADALGERGVARETRAVKLLYLALTSRVLRRPVSAVITGPAGNPSSSSAHWISSRVVRTTT